MNPLKLSRLLAIVACSAPIVLPICVHAGAPRYFVTDLGSVGDTYSEGDGINASGQVTGYANPNGGPDQAMRWSGTTPTYLSSLGGGLSYGYGINASGQVAGNSRITGNSGYRHAARWTDTTPQDLGTLGGTDSYGYGINDAGQVAGYSWKINNSTYHAVRWSGMTAVDLGALNGYDASQGLGINASGQVAGWSMIRALGVARAVRWTGTTPENLVPLNGHNTSYGFSINASGQVAGYSIAAGGTRRAVMWTGTTPTDLGTLGGNDSIASGINDFGDVVGHCGGTANRLFLYTGGMMYDLHALILPGADAGAADLRLVEGGVINNVGQIVAIGTVSGRTHALRLDPTPDTDGDGVPDIYETGTGIYVSPTNTGTDPNRADTDSDGLTDGQEVYIFHTNPNLKDTDGDGWDDAFEIAIGFNPTDATSTPDTFSSIRTATEYRFAAANGISYRIEASTDLANWTTIETNIIGAGGVITRFYSIEGQPKRFFRSRRN